MGSKEENKTQTKPNRKKTQTIEKQQNNTEKSRPRLAHLRTQVQPENAEKQKNWFEGAVFGKKVALKKEKEIKTE